MTSTPHHLYNARYYREHRLAEIGRVRARQAATRQFLRDLRCRPCADCGAVLPPYAMDFDHRKPEEKKVALAAGKALLKSRMELLAEIAKCDVVCANCHAIRTYAQTQDRKARLSPEEWTPGMSRYIGTKRRRWRANAEFLNDLRDVPCLDCNRRFPSYVMQFDHRDGNTKQCAVSRLIHRSRKLILEEVAKCDIVCANCHRERTYHRREQLRAGVAQPGRAPAFQAGCRGSESRLPLRFVVDLEAQRFVVVLFPLDQPTPARLESG